MNQPFEPLQGHWIWRQKLTHRCCVGTTRLALRPLRPLLQPQLNRLLPPVAAHRIVADTFLAITARRRV